MQKTCQQCKNEFEIDKQDQDYYAGIDVPYPTWCSICRLMRRLSFLNWISLYRRDCDSCHESIVSIHHDKKPYKVYCSVCWWKDNWDGTEYAMDYNPDRNFFEQILELRNKSNFMALENLHTSLVNSNFVNATAYLKDCYMCFNADYGEKSAYSLMFEHVEECLDIYRAKNAELCYECVGIYKCYHCIYSDELDSCVDVLFSRSLVGCTDCFGCINLKNKSYHIYNVPYTKEIYHQKIKEMKLDTREGIKKAYNDSRQFWDKHSRRFVIGNSRNINTTGDFVYESKNTKDGYIVSGAEDCRYVSLLSMSTTKNCYDYTNWGNMVENLYECLTVGEGAYNNKFCIQCWPQAMNMEYCMYAISSQNCFGCVNLKRKKYCILNKEYSKQDYEKLKAQIIEDIKNNPYIDKYGKTYSYGELFPVELSSFAYNETMVNYFFPKTKEQAIADGYQWFDQDIKKYKITIDKYSIPESYEEITDNILNEIIECSICNTGFNIGELELYLHHKIKIPLPDACWKCRFKRRFDSTNKPMLYKRDCMKCSSSIVSSYDISRKEIVYCEKCYQEEII